MWTPPVASRTSGDRRGRSSPRGCTCSRSGRGWRRRRRSGDSASSSRGSSGKENLCTLKRSRRWWMSTGPPMWPWPKRSRTSDSTREHGEEARVSAAYCWGIWRERAHSPGRESDDTEILRLTGKHLEARGVQVVLKRPDEVIGTVDARPLGVFLMCEQSEILHH